jgi:hypothetical protein
MLPARPLTAKRQLDHSDEPIGPPAKAHKCQTELPKPPAKPPTSKGKRAPYHRAEAPANKGKRPLDHHAKSPDPPAKAHKSQASTHKRQAEAPKRQAEAPKSQAEAPKHPAKTAPWVELHKQLMKAPNYQAETHTLLDGYYIDTYTRIYIKEVEAAAANDYIDGDEVADCAKYYMHSGQNFCVTCWACPDCRHHCSLIELNILHKSHPDLIQLYINQLRQHLINSSRYQITVY